MEKVDEELPQSFSHVERKWAEETVTIKKHIYTVVGGQKIKC